MILVPLPTFVESAEALDPHVRHEMCVEITGMISDWVSYGASLSEWWDGFPVALATYGLYLSHVQGERSILAPHMRSLWETLRQPRKMAAMPPWLGDIEIHQVHREMLGWTVSKETS